MRRTVSPFYLALAIIFLAVYLLATAARVQAPPPVAPSGPARVPSESTQITPPHLKPAQRSTAAQQLVGTWKLIAVDRRDANGTRQQCLYRTLTSMSAAGQVSHPKEIAAFSRHTE